MYFSLKAIKFCLHCTVGSTWRGTDKMEGSSRTWTLQSCKTSSLYFFSSFEPSKAWFFTENVPHYCIQTHVFHSLALNNNHERKLYFGIVSSQITPFLRHHNHQVFASWNGLTHLEIENGSGVLTEPIHYLKSLSVTTPNLESLKIT